MKKLFIFLFIFWSTICLAAPSITSISGTYTNGQTITIGGSGFGTKSQAAPQISSYDHPTSAYNWGSGGSYDAAWTYNGSQTAISTAVKRSTLPQSTYSSRATMNGGYNNIGYNSGSAWVDSYVSYWLYQDYTDYHLADGENGFKYFRWYVDSGGVGDLILCWIGTGSTPSNMQINTEALASTCAYVLDYNPYSWAKYSTTYLHLRQNGHIPSTQAWHHYEIYFHIPTDPNTCTNSGYMMIDGETSVRWHDIRMSSSTNNNNRILRLGHVSGAMSATQYDYIDQVYVDNTLARVILSSSSTMTSWPDIASERHTEIQVPTSWADGSIQVTLNRGSFADSSTVYVYVVDSTGAVNSTGYTVTLGGSAGATYYIDPSQTDPSEDGTITHPFNAWSDVTWAAGNTYLQKRGTTSTVQIQPTTGGSAGNYITIGAYGTGAKPIIASASGHGVYLGYASTPKSYFIIENLDIRPADSGIVGSTASDTNHLLIDSCDITGALNGGITIVSTGTDIEIKYCTITDTGLSTASVYAINFTGTGAVHVHHCTVTNVGRAGTADNSDGISLGGTVGGNGSIIEYCTVTGQNGSNGSGIDLAHSLNTDNLSISATARYNDVSDCEGRCIGVMGDSLLGSRILIYDNYLHDSYTGIHCYEKCTIQIYNNTIVNNTYAGCRFSGSDTDGPRTGYFYNNIVSGNELYKMAHHPTGASGGPYTLTCDYNDYYASSSMVLRYNGTSYSTVATWAAARGDDSHPSPAIGNPLLTGYVLASGSPCINAGTTLSDVTTDIRGVIRPQGSAYDIGAYEFKNATLWNCGLSGGGGVR